MAQAEHNTHTSQEAPPQEQYTLDLDGFHVKVGKTKAGMLAVEITSDTSDQALRFAYPADLSRTITYNTPTRRGQAETELPPLSLSGVPEQTHTVVSTNGRDQATPASLPSPTVPVHREQSGKREEEPEERITIYGRIIADPRFRTSPEGRDEIYLIFFEKPWADERSYSNTTEEKDQQDITWTVKVTGGENLALVKDIQKGGQGHRITGVPSDEVKLDGKKTQHGLLFRTIEPFAVSSPSKVKRPDGRRP